MKKKMFIAFSAVSLFIVGLLIVSCSSDTNDLDIVPLAEKQQASQDLSSESDWADFYANVESLNTKYATKNVEERILPKDSFIVNPNMPDIPGRDIIGALYWAEFTSTTSSEGNGIVGMVIISSIYSCLAYKESSSFQNNGTPLNITLRDISAINNLTDNHPIKLIGQQHNQLLSAIINSNIDLSERTFSQLVQIFCDKYEQLYSSSISREQRNVLRTAVENYTPTMSTNVQRANSQFRSTTTSMPINTKRTYTDEYLGIVRAAQLNTYDKLQMSIYAGMLYYSGSLWIVQ